MSDAKYSKVESGYEPDTPTMEVEAGSFVDDGKTAVAAAPMAEFRKHASPRDKRPWRHTLLAMFPWVLSTVLAAALLVQGRLLAGRTGGDLDPAGLPPKCAEHHQERYSPAGEAIKYHDVTFFRAFGADNSSGYISPYQGWPTDEKDKLWEDMYAKGILIGIDEASHSRLLADSERVAAENQTDRRMVGLDVFHQLHCLDALRKSIYPRRYNSSILDDDGRAVNYGHWMHLDHCVESLRQSLTCSADVAAYTFRWSDTAKLMVAQVGGLHRCRDFSAIQEWAFARHVDESNARSHVEDVPAEEGGGVRIVDYSDHFDYRTKPWKPPGWYHAADEL